MRLLSLIAAFVASGTLAIYMLTCSVNNTPPAPVHPIVGKWQLNITNGHPITTESYVINEYMSNGILLQESNDPKNRYLKSEGVYRIENFVLYTSFQMPDGRVKKYECRVIELSGTRLVIATINNSDFSDTTAVYEKITE